MCIEEKLKLRKFSSNASEQRSRQNIFAEILQSAFFCNRFSKELYNVEIQWLEVGLNLDL